MLLELLRSPLAPVVAQSPRSPPPTRTCVHSACVTQTTASQVPGKGKQIVFPSAPLHPGKEKCHALTRAKASLSVAKDPASPLALSTQGFSK